MNLRLDREAFPESDDESPHDLKTITLETMVGCWPWRNNRSLRLMTPDLELSGGGNMTQGSSYFHRSVLNWCGSAFLPVLAFSIAALFPSGRLCAQAVTAISGTVMDSTGAVMPNVAVTITNNTTNVVSQATTSSVGTFTVIGLKPGLYTVAAEATGFKRSVQNNVTVEVATTSTVVLQMVPGARDATVSVTASAISLNTASPALGTTLEPELVKTAPIEINSLARQLDSFMYLAPGVQGNATSHNINGGLTFENEVQFNGVPVAFVQYSGNSNPYQSAV